jgi:hypothetical protein
MRILWTVVLAFVVLSAESVLARYFGPMPLRMEITVVAICFLALRAGTLPGEAVSFLLGYLLDAMSGRATGLFTFLGVFLFLLGRVTASLVQVRSAMGFAFFVLGGDVVHGMLSLVFSWMVLPEPPAFSALSLALQAVLTAVGAFILYPVFARLEPDGDRPKAGALL